MGPLSDETLPAHRRFMAEGVPGMGPAGLTAGGRVRVEERHPPGPDGAPDITLLILSPRGPGVPRRISTTAAQRVAGSVRGMRKFHTFPSRSGANMRWPRPRWAAAATEASAVDWFGCILHAT